MDEEMNVKDRQLEDLTNYVLLLEAEIEGYKKEKEEREKQVEDNYICVCK